MCIKGIYEIQPVSGSDGALLSELQEAISWWLEPSGIFSVRSLYLKLYQGIPNKHFSEL
jgi:hypothetical protein